MSAHPLTQAAYLTFVRDQASAPLSDSMAEFLAAHGETVTDPAHLKQGILLVPYWDRIEAKLRKAQA